MESQRSGGLFPLGALSFPSLDRLLWDHHAVFGLRLATDLGEKFQRPTDIDTDGHR